MDSPNRAFGEIAEAMSPLDDSSMLEICHFATAIVVARTKQGIDVDGHSFKPYTEEYARTKQGIDVDGHSFKPYTEEYAKVRAKRGLSSKPDLAVTGHMLGAMIPQNSAPGEVSVRFLSHVEAEKAAAHNYGVDKTVDVKSHRRSVAVNVYTGQRVSKDEARKDRRRKNKKVATREEGVGSFKRHQHTPKREFADIRMQREVDAIAAVIDDAIFGRIEKTVK